MIKRLALILLLQKCCIGLFCQLSSADTLLIEELYFEILEENEKGNFEQAMFKSDSLIAFCERKRNWYYAYAGGIAVKINLATVNNKIDILYESIQLLDNKIGEHFDELGEYAESMRFDNRLRLGMYYIKRGNMNRAQELLDNLLSEEVLKKNNYLEMPNLLMSLSKIHKFQGNYLQALNYIHECKKAFFTLKTPYPFGYEPLIYKHIADINALIGNEKLAEENYIKSIDLYNTVKTPSKILLNGVVNSYNAYAQFNLDRNYTKKAIYVLEKSLHLQQKSVSETEKTYRLLAEAYLDDKEYSKAEELLLESIKQNKYDSKNYPLARAYTIMAEVYAKQNRLEFALNYYQKALINLQDDFDNPNFCENPTDFENVLSKKDLIKVFHQKAITLFKVSKEEPTYLPCAWKTIQLAIDLLDNIKLDNTSDTDKQLLLEDSYSIFEDAIKISLAQASEKGNKYAFKVGSPSI